MNGATSVLRGHCPGPATTRKYFWFDSFPAFVPVAFELTVLLAGLATVFGLLGRCRLAPGRKPRRRLQG